MADILEKARKGNKEAMQLLYNANKKRIYRLITLLLTDEAVAATITAKIFRNIWTAVIDGDVQTEEGFEKKLIERTVSYCKAHIAKKDPKAFKIPLNKNFTVSEHFSDKLLKADDASVFIAKNLPPLQRFIYVLHGCFGYSAVALSLLFKINENTVKIALDAEETNIRRLLASWDSTAVLSVSDFHRGLEKLDGVSVPTEVDEAVCIIIVDVCMPIIEKAKKQRNKLILYISAGLIGSCLLVFVAFGIANSLSSGNVTTDEPSESTFGIVSESSTGEDIVYTTEYTTTHYADIVIENYGTITVALDGNKAPITVENFVTLANAGFYDGLTFHRIVEGFVMQGGDPDGDGTGGNKDADGKEITISGEFTANGSDNNLSHTAGAISMARSNDYDSASSQFFIVHTDDYIDVLDGQYAVFGYVIEGMNLVNSICTGTYTMDENETINASEQPVITSITIRKVEEENSGGSTETSETPTEDINGNTDTSVADDTNTNTDTETDADVGIDTNAENGTDEITEGNEV